MLKIIIPDNELFNEDTNEIIKINGQEISLEHSLISISKWESKYKKPFLENNKKTVDEILDYIKCMTITPNVNSNIFLGLTEDNIKDVIEYIDDPMTATTFNTIGPEKKSKEFITSELIYYWMIANNVPVEFERWHINRLLTLIKVCTIKNNPNKKKMSKQQIISQNKAINDARRKALGTKG